MARKGPVVSIGLPVHNGAAFLAETIEAILDQDFTDFELIVSDNASSDATPEICRRFSAEPRLRHYRQDRNIGGGPNFCFVFDKARGRYFHWCGHDDIHEPGWLAACVAALDAAPEAVAVHTRSVYFNDGRGDGRVWYRDYSDAFDLRDPDPLARWRAAVLHPDVEPSAIFGLFRREALARTHLIASYRGSDKVLLRVLALQGQIHAIDGPRLWRWNPPERAGSRIQDTRGWIRWLTGAEPTGHHSYRLRWIQEYRKALRDSGLDARQRRRAMWPVWRFAWRERHEVWRDLRRAAKARLRGK
jgi:glycosyltransferase involved in cell wall biosynthesis